VFLIRRGLFKGIRTAEERQAQKPQCSTTKGSVIKIIQGQFILILHWSQASISGYVVDLAKDLQMSRRQDKKIELKE
jgi:hypothetical protein